MAHAVVQLGMMGKDVADDDRAQKLAKCDLATAKWFASSPNCKGKSADSRSRARRSRMTLPMHIRSLFVPWVGRSHPRNRLGAGWQC